MPKSSSSLIPPKDLWLPLLPILPLVALTFLLSALTNIDETKKLNFLKFDFKAEYVSKPALDYIHIGDVLAYSGITSFHVFVCAVVIIYFAYLIRYLPPRERTGSLSFLVLILAVLIILIIWFKGFANDILLVQLGFKATCIAINGADLATQLVGQDGCFAEGDTGKISWLAWIPTFAGMGAVAFVAAFSYGNTVGLPSIEDSDWRTVFEGRVKALQRSFYALSAVLVSSTITIMLFAGLPKSLFKNSNGTVAKAVAEYAGGLGTFWGVLFTLTLAATFAAPAFRLLHHAYRTSEATTGSPGLRAWLHEHLFVSLKRQVGNLLVLLGPLLAGTLNSLVSLIGGK